MKITRVGIAAKPGSPGASKVALDAGKFLESKGIDVCYTGEALPGQAGSRAVALEDMAADLVVVVGGDGTIMRTAQRVNAIPILGIKVGALGFLCETTPDNARDALERVIANKFYLDYKTKLKANYRGMQLPDALNEVLVTTTKPSKILALAVYKDGEPIHRGRADGIIVSTTTGSTAYALSAGGPVVDPELDAMEVIFICPLTPGLRPMMFPTSTKIEVKVLSGPSTGLLVMDGQTTTQVDFDVPIAIERSEKAAAFVRVNTSDFYKRIRQKIKLGFET